MSADVTARFEDLLAREESEIPLDEGCLLIAAHLVPGVDVERELGRLDELAAAVPEPTLTGLLDHLFRTEQFRGNTAEYGDPANSLLNVVLDRRLGIPITLSVLTIEVGRRAGVPLVPIGLPGHFLVGSGEDQDRFVDAFSGGVQLDAAACRRLMVHLYGTDIAFDDRWLEPMGPRAVLARVLANLKRAYLAARDRGALTTVLRLRQLVPGVPTGERRELADVLAAQGRFDLAASELEGLADEVEGGELPPDVPAVDELQAKAVRLRARLN